MDKSIRDIRRFVVNLMITSEWSTQGRSNFYTTKNLNIKKDFDNGGWLFSINEGNSYHRFVDIKLNKIFVYILLIFVKHSVKKQSENRKHDKLKNEWSNFLKSNKEIDRDNKINKIIK